MGTKKYVIIPEWLTLAGLKPPRMFRLSPIIYHSNDCHGN